MVVFLDAFQRSLWEAYDGNYAMDMSMTMVKRPNISDENEVMWLQPAREIPHELHALSLTDKSFCIM